MCLSDSPEENGNQSQSSLKHNHLQKIPHNALQTSRIRPETWSLTGDIEWPGNSVDSVGQVGTTVEQTLLVLVLFSWNLQSVIEQSALSFTLTLLLLHEVELSY